MTWYALMLCQLKYRNFPINKYKGMLFMPKKYYAVKEGKVAGIYETWDECKRQVHGFKGATYKSFLTLEEAEKFMTGDECSGIKTQNHENEIANDKDKAIAYVDGSYHIKTKAFSYGMVIFYDGKEEYFSEKIEDEELATMRNVAGEIKGSERAMRYCLENDIKSIDIHYDYEGISKWCKGEWKTNKEGTIAYKKFYDSIKSELNVNFIKVKAHSGDKYNDMADELAKKALGIL